MTRLWLVRADKAGEREAQALAEGLAAPGFLEVGDLSAATDRDAIFALVKAALPSHGDKACLNYAAQLNQFRNSMRRGDLVVLPRKQTPTVAVGRVAADYAFSADPALRHMRRVEWLRTDVPRTAIKQDLLHSLGAAMTICEISRNDALRRIQVVASTGRDPGPVSGSVRPGRAEQQPEPGVVAEEAPPDLGEIAGQRVIALIKSRFAGHALAELVADILRADGYNVRVSPPGPDGGRDILAADGPLGFGERRICVQVKSGDKAADNQVVLVLQAAMGNAKAATGLLVSLGGVTEPAKRLLGANFFALRPWQMPELLAELYRTYPKLPDETRARLPLKQIWVPVPQDVEAGG